MFEIRRREHFEKRNCSLFNFGISFCFLLVSPGSAWFGISSLIRRTRSARRRKHDCSTSGSTTFFGFFGLSFSVWKFASCLRFNICRGRLQDFANQTIILWIEEQQSRLFQVGANAQPVPCDLEHCLGNNSHHSIVSPQLWFLQFASLAALCGGNTGPWSCSAEQYSDWTLVAVFLW